MMNERKKEKQNYRINHWSFQVQISAYQLKTVLLKTIIKEIWQKSYEDCQVLRRSDKYNINDSNHKGYYKF